MAIVDHFYFCSQSSYLQTTRYSDRVETGNPPIVMTAEWICSTMQKAPHVNWKGKKEILPIYARAFSSRLYHYSRINAVILSHSWRSMLKARPSWMGLWATRPNGRSACPWQEGWNEMIFKVPSNPNCSIIYQRKGDQSIIVVFSTEVMCWPRLQKAGKDSNSQRLNCYWKYGDSNSSGKRKS